MHIAVNGWFWGQMTTGSGQYLHHLVYHLPQIAEGHVFSLLLARDSRSTAANGQRLAFPPGWGQYELATPLDRVNHNLAKVWFEQVAFPLACRRLGADVAWVPYWGAPWWRCGCLVVTVHDLIPLLLPAYWGGWPQRLYTWLVSQTARRAILVLTDSQASRQDILTHLRVAPERVRAIHLAAAERFRPVADPLELQRVRQCYGLPERFMLYLGGFDVRKNVPTLISAYSRFLRQQGAGAAVPRLVIAGQLPKGNSDFAPDPRQVVAREGLESQVQFIGWVEEADKPALYSLADLFVFPSAYEGFGLPVVEALACGTPVVTSDRSALPEIAPGAVLADPGDAASLAEALAVGLRQSRGDVLRPRRTWREVAEDTWAAIKDCCSH